MNSQNLSITPDGRYAVFFGQVNSNVLPYATMIHVVRLDPDGGLAYLADRRVIFNGALFSSSAIAQVNPLNADASWMQYE